MIHPAHASWRSEVLQGILWVFSGLGVPVIAYVLATTSRGITRPSTLCALLLTAALLLITVARQWSFTLRAMSFIAITYLGGALSALHFGLTPGPILLMLIVVVTCGLFFGQWWLWGGLLVTGASLASVVTLHTMGVLATQQLELLDLSQGWNAIRVTMVYLLLTGLIAFSVSYIVHRIEQSLRETSEALDRYEAERHERTEVEAALRASEETYRHLVENINDVIYATDDKGIITYLSPTVEAQSGYKPSELIGRAFSAFIYEADGQRILNKFEQVRSGQLEPSEYRMVTKSGEIRWIRASSRPLYQEDRVVGLIGVYIDITEQKGLEEQLRHAQKVEAIGTLAGGIAHEFNNILAAILGFTDLTQYEVPEGSAAWANLQQVLQAGYRAKDLVQQILAFSRQSDQTREPLSLVTVIQEGLTLLRASLPTTIAINLHVNEAIGTILANRNQIHQIVVNLCTNAAYAMQATGGSITIAVENIEVDDTFASSHSGLHPGPYVQLRVRDTGTGMASEVAERIFDPFFTTKDVGEGTGLGLAIVHGIVASHGGAINVESTPGQGTTFDIYLPQITVATPGDTSPPTEELPPAKGAILFVDDEEMLARVGHAMLQRLGYDVVSTTSSVEALETFRAMPQYFDVVITDQTMPTLTGEHLVRDLRRIRSDIPIILCTGFSHVMQAEKAQALGVDAFCMKPMVARELATTIQQVLDKRTTTVSMRTARRQVVHQGSSSPNSDAGISRTRRKPTNP